MLMAKTIAVSDEVYELLKKAKLPDESFSEVIRRSLERGRTLSQICGSGTISLEDWKEAKAILHRAQATTIRELSESRQ